jgi:hypothetical protein
MKNTARNELLTRFQAMKANDGLRDLKFLLGGRASDSTVEDVCADVLAFYEKVQSGDVTPQATWGDGTGCKVKE